MVRRKQPDQSMLVYLFGIIIVCLVASICGAGGTTAYYITEYDQFEQDFSNEQLQDVDKVKNYCQTTGICFDGLIGWYDVVSFSGKDHLWYDKSKECNNLIINRETKEYKELLKRVVNLQKYGNLTQNEINTIEEKFDIEYSNTSLKNLSKLATDELNAIREDESEKRENLQMITVSSNKVFGTKNDSIEFPKEMFTKTDNYTFVHLTRYFPSADSGDSKRIFQGDDTNYVSGFHNTGSGACYQDHWIKRGEDLSTVNDNGSKVHPWILSIEHKGEYAKNNESFTVTDDMSKVKIPTTVMVNKGKYPDHTSVFQIWEMLVYDRKLNTDEIEKVREYMNKDYLW